MYVDFIVKQFDKYIDDVALITNDHQVTYQDLKNEFEYWNKAIQEKNIRNKVVTVQGEFCAETIGLMLAIIENENVYVPLAPSVKNIDRYWKVSEAQVFVNPYERTIEINDKDLEHPILKTILEERKNPGLILFSSGTTGEPKAAVHDLVPMLKKYTAEGKKISSIAFLLFDHIGGFNTVMYNISNGGKMVTLKNRSPQEVCKAIEAHQIEVLPTSPSFINMILYSKVYEQYDISALRLITYGTEPMPEATLLAFNRLFPKIRLKQTYGLSELGIMRTKSEGSDSLWLKLGDDEHQIDIRDGILWIKTEMAMLGYLNAESPFDEAGWFNTKDRVEVKGEYIKILGRESELINVGGEKVYPAEVESVILEIEGVQDAIVKGEENPMLGRIVVCEVALAPELDQKEMLKTIKRVCRENLEKFKRPMKITVQDSNFVTSRFKRKR